MNSKIFEEDEEEEENANPNIYGLEPGVNYLRPRKEPSGAMLELWGRLSAGTGSNDEQLAEEMWATLRQLAGFMRGLELAAKERRIRRLTNCTGDWTRFCQSEERFAASLDTGKRTMAGLWRALRLGSAQHTRLQPAQIYSRISRFEEFAVDKPPRARIQELSVCLKEIIGRFANICEAEGVEHGLPVMAPDVPPAIESLPKIKKKVSTFRLPSVDLPDVKKETESHNIMQEFGDQLDSADPIQDPGSLMPVEFLWEYCRRDRSTPMYEDMGTVGKSGFAQEFVVVCRLRNMSGEGRAKRKMLAKQCAAATVIRSLLRKQKLERLPENARPLSQQERLLAIRSMSEVLDFEKDLEKISGEEYHRMPIFTPVVNSSGNHVRCKALGYNAVGYGRSKDVARRMASKLILDMHLEAKELAKQKTKQKFQASKNAMKCVEVVKS